LRPWGGVAPAAILIARLDEIMAELRQAPDWTPPDPAQVAAILEWLKARAS
jgi:hypothetical protein